MVELLLDSSFFLISRDNRKSLNPTLNHSIGTIEEFGIAWVYMREVKMNRMVADRKHVCES